MKRIAFTLLACSAVAAACSNPTNTIETTDVDAASITSTVDITSNGAGATVRLAWSTSTDPTRALVVGAGHRLVVRAADAPARDLAFVEDAYYAYLPTTSQTVTIALLEPSGELAFDVPLPKDFTVEGPPTPVSRSAPMELKWVPDPSRGASLQLTSPCFGLPIDRVVAQDTGSFTFYPGDFGAVKTACTLSIAVQRKGTFASTTPFRMTGVVAQVRTIRLETDP